MRLIDGDALLTILEGEREYHEKNGLQIRADGVMDAIMDVISAPTIQPEPCEDAVSRAELLSAFPYDDEPTVTKCSLRMTINHLPSVTPKNVPDTNVGGCEDAVSRKALRKWIKAEANPYAVDNPKLDFDTSCLILGHLANMPSVTPQPKTGKWILQDGYRCNRCNYKLQTTGLPTACPNCDAKMEGAECG